MRQKRVLGSSSGVFEELSEWRSTFNDFCFDDLSKWMNCINFLLFRLFNRIKARPLNPCRILLLLLQTPITFNSRLTKLIPTSSSESVIPSSEFFSHFNFFSPSERFTTKTKQSCTKATGRHLQGLRESLNNWKNISTMLFVQPTLCFFSFSKLVGRLDCLCLQVSVGAFVCWNSESGDGNFYEQDKTTIRIPLSCSLVLTYGAPIGMC